MSHHDLLALMYVNYLNKMLYDLLRPTIYTLVVTVLGGMKNMV